MIILQNFTSHKASKIAECLSGIGSYASKPMIDSQNRNLIRGWLNGIGFETNTYINTSIEGLAKAYYSCNDGRALHLIPFIANAGITEPQDVLSNLSLAISRLDGSFTGPLPELADVVGYLKYAGIETAPKKEDVKETVPTSGVTQWIKQQNTNDATYSSTETKPTAKQDAGNGSNTNSEAEQALKTLLALMSKPQAAAEIDETRVIELIKKHGVSTEIVLKGSGETKKIPTGLHHECLPIVVKMLSAGVNVMLVGAAGSGKTTIADQAAKILEIPFYFNGALSSEYKLSGFVDAQGRIVSTAFRKAYETGGLYLFDEIDASMPDVLLAFNAALANGHADFPDGAINRHEKFVCMAAANTFGKGADRVYVGRNQLDGASLDRFAVLNVDYDEKLETSLAGNDAWVKTVQKIRKAVYDLKIRHIVSPRASISGAKLLNAGISEREVLDMVVWKGLDKDSITKIRNQANI